MSDSFLRREDFVLTPPYGGAFDGALKAFFEYAEFLLREGHERASSHADIEGNKIIFEAMQPHLNRNFNPHLFGGLKTSLLAEPSKASLYRPALILKRLFARAELIERQMFKNRERLKAARQRRAIEDEPIEIIFSPLYFVRQYLTDPDYTASDAYAHYLIRAQIFSDALKFAATHPDTEVSASPDEPLKQIRAYIQFKRIVASLQKIERHWEKGDNVAPANATDFIVMHLLASRGYLVLRFGEKFLRDRQEFRVSRASFIASKQLATGRRRVDSKEVSETYEFRVLPEVHRLPLAAELINEIDGLPIPVPGSDAVLYRGLRFQEDSGIVLRFSGRTGTGKTSIALGLAVALASLGTRTVYLSCEEEPRDLEHRIQTLVPQNLRRFEAFNRIDDEWFSAEYVQGTRSEKYKKVQEFLLYLRGRFATHIKDRWRTPPGSTPLLIVIDGVHEILGGGDREEFAAEARELITRCRETGAVVIVLSAKNEQARPDELDYLVDFVAGLDFAPTKDAWERPVRTITLQKTRRQTSRGGTHVLHISGRQGLRIAPQVASQLDQRRDFKWVEPRSDRFFDFLISPSRKLSKAAIPLQPQIRIFDRSQILVTGVGSGGKSAFGLKLLTTRLLGAHELTTPKGRRRAVARGEKSLFEEGLLSEESDQEEIENEGRAIDLGTTWFESTLPSTRKLLILSFLYQEDYYRKLWKRIAPFRREDALAKDSSPRIEFDVHSFSPGFLRPEDFLTAISQMLDKHELEGWPYDGVMLDGLHNVYLQFPYLEQSEMVWPMLFQMLRTRGLTVVTTHTYFTIDPGNDAQRLDADDVDSARRRAGPVLHALVQATDFRIRVTPEKWQDAERLARRFNGVDFGTRVDVIGAFGQALPHAPLYWNRDEGVVFGLTEGERERVLRRKRDESD